MSKRQQTVGCMSEMYLACKKAAQRTDSDPAALGDIDVNINGEPVRSK